MLKGKYGKTKRTLDFLKEYYGLGDNDYNNYLFCDYVHKLSENKELFLYIQRRWDLIHLSGSTKISIILGFIIGSCELLITSNFSLNAVILFIPYTIISLVFVLLMRNSLHKALDQHSEAVDAIIREVVLWKKQFPKWIARMVFTPEYFKPDSNTC